ncbi:hypothetical protein ACFW04_000035 [Cataglyphis niger]
MANIASVSIAICLFLLVKSVFCVAAAIYFLLTLVIKACDHGHKPS